MSTLIRPGESDRDYTRRHAVAYAAQSLSFGHLADEYADWYLSREMPDNLGADTFDGSDLPATGHDRVWPEWVRTLDKSAN